MSRVRSAILAAAIAAQASPAAAGSPYEGWRTSSYPAYVGRGYGDRRPLDGSYRAGPPAPIWQGLYVGGHLGGGWGGVTLKGLSSDSIDASGFAGGIHAGYNVQFDRWVGGFEVDASWTNAGGSATYPGGISASTEVDWLSSARLRLGYSFDKVLLYATGGVAFADLNVRTTALGVTSSTSEIVSGWTLGAGLEMKFTPNVSARLEALHYRFGDERFGTSAGVLSVDKDITTVRAGLSLHLN